MKIPKLNSIVIVRWVDAFFSDGWKPREEVDGELLSCSTVGYLIRDDKASVTIANSLGREDDSVADCLTIPKSAIIAVRVLK